MIILKIVDQKNSSHFESKLKVFWFQSVDFEDSQPGRFYWLTDTRHRR